MEKPTITTIMSEYGMLGTGGAIILALIYKIWRILKLDYNIDDLTKIEKEIRDELRCDVKDLKDELKNIQAEHDSCEKEKNRILNELQKIHHDLTNLNMKVNVCRSENPLCHFNRRSTDNNGNNNGQS